jgi:N6-L-threonylcarbamoyladenine synthase
LISGGHCQLVAVEGVGRYRLYGTTIDDALGEAFDKTAKMMGLPYPGGPALEKLARQGDGKRFALPRPLLGRKGADFSFSGLKTAVRQAISECPNGEGWKADLAASFQASILDVLRDRVTSAMQQFREDFAAAQHPVLVAAGGVAANGAIRSLLGSLSSERGFLLALPPPALCTDNGAMVAWAGVERLEAGLTDSLGIMPLARWPLESLKNFYSGAS